MGNEWVRIPEPVEAEADRRQLCAILTACGLEVRIVRVRATQRGTPKRYVEYRQNDIGVITPQNVE